MRAPRTGRPHTVALILVNENGRLGWFLLMNQTLVLLARQLWQAALTLLVALGCLRLIVVAITTSSAAFSFLPHPLKTRRGVNDSSQNIYCIQSLSTLNEWQKLGWRS